MPSCVSAACQGLPYLTLCASLLSLQDISVRDVVIWHIGVLSKVPFQKLTRCYTHFSTTFADCQAINTKILPKCCSVLNI